MQYSNGRKCMSIYETLSIVQNELKAPKSQYNSFGKYNYRNCEDILEALKPINAKHNACVTLSDDVVVVNDRFYVVATATFYADGEHISVTAYARESLDKKGMDSAQVTGATSSYARKYALNGLFAIDDTKDADGYDNRAAEPQKATKPQAKKSATNDEDLKKIQNTVKMHLRTLSQKTGKTDGTIYKEALAQTNTKGETVADLQQVAIYLMNEITKL